MIFEKAMAKIEQCGYMQQTAEGEFESYFLEQYTSPRQDDAENEAVLRKKADYFRILDKILNNPIKQRHSLDIMYPTQAIYDVCDKEYTSATY